MRVAISESQFKKDLKLAAKQHKNIDELLQIIKALQQEKPLPPKNKNHKLKGKYTGYWECHVEPDWLLVYKLAPGKLILSRIASHSELF
jgi:mRNA interferase YafQ